MTAPAILARPVRPIPQVSARLSAETTPQKAAIVKSIAAGLLWHPGCHCPGCGQRQWHVGRATADCAVCAAALIIAHESVCSTTEGDAEWLAA